MILDHLSMYCTISAIDEQYYTVVFKSLLLKFNSKASVNENIHSGALSQLHENWDIYFPINHHT